MSVKELQQRFYSDPEWHQIEDLIRGYIEPLKDMSTIDTSQPAENVKAEIIGRLLAYKSLNEFIEQTKLVGHSHPKPINSPFR